MSETEVPTVPQPLIWTDPGRMSGTPCFNRTRVPVQILFDHLVAGERLDVFLEGFPDVTREHAVAVLKHARLQIEKKYE